MQPAFGPEQLAALLATAEGKKAFADAVLAAFKQSHGSTGGTYNVDELRFLAASLDSHAYMAAHMAAARRFPNAHALMDFATSAVSVRGPALEFGVWTGKSINHIARRLPGRAVYGFDSFEGLPEQWNNLAGGTFSTSGSLPAVPGNVTLIPGWFDRTLGPFVDAHAFEAIGLLHVDCDLYSSTQTVFAYLHKRIVPGTIIVFDEYYNYPGWQLHEHRAFREYCAARNVRYDYIGLVPAYPQVAVRIVA